MTDWYCYKHKVKMTETDVALKYMQLVQYIPGLKCPVGGEAYLTEEVVMTIVKAAEDALEEK
jgi:hypothetical protein